MSTEFLMDLAVTAIDRWNRLSPEEQRRFRELAGRAGGPPSTSLSVQEQKELGRLWKRLEVRRLIREGIASLTRRELKPAEPPRHEKAEAQLPD
jgi:hypothetical protein